MKKRLRVPLLFCFLLLFCASFVRAPQFRFAWLSDAHVGSTNAAADLEASVRDLNDLAGIEFVLVSGDVTEMGADAELEQAKSILDRLEKPYYILPGNHDTKWSESDFTTGSAVYATPAIADGKAVFGSTDKNIYCLEVKNGRLLWKVATGAAVVGGAAIEKGTVYIGGSDRTFRAIELASGKVIWEFHGLGGFVETRPLVYRGKVIFGAWDTWLYALNAADGSLAWKWSNGGRALLYSPAACWPAGAGGKVFIAAPDRYLTAIDAATGQTVWRSNQFAVRETVGVSRDGRRVYARCINDTVVALSASAAQPELLWSTNCGYGYDIDPSMPVEMGGTVYFGTKNGLVYALDGRMGAVLWKYRIGVTVVNTPLPVNARQAVFTDLDGRIVLLMSR